MAETAHSQTTSTLNDEHNHSKRHPRRRKHPSQPFAQIDGAVSDSVMYPSATSPYSKKETKQRHQSVAISTPPKPSGVEALNGNRQLPASLGGNMLLATPLKEQAYAGPTFQASPAPSSLPVPKFFSRSVPNVAGQSLAARMGGEQTPGKEDSSPETDVVSPQPPFAEGPRSPLDMFFKADKLEKEKSRSSSMTSPEMAVRQQPPVTEPRQGQQSSRSAFLRELDGENEEMLSPKSIPPNKRQFPTERPTSSPNMTDTGSEGESEREAHTKALKELLFHNVNATSHQSNSPPPSLAYSQSNGGCPNPPLATPPPFQRSTSGPSTPTPSLEQQQNHYSLHYGNRNLSPLFKAARNDTPSRPSGLRQHELASDVPPGPNGVYNHSHSHNHIHNHQVDPNSFSRNYIDQHVRASGPANVPQLPLVAGSTPNLPSSSTTTTSGYIQHGVIQTGDNNGIATTGASPRTSNTTRGGVGVDGGGGGGGGGESRDIKGMEDDLRRMLNLNVLSN